MLFRLSHKVTWPTPVLSTIRVTQTVIPLWSEHKNILLLAKPVRSIPHTYMLQHFRTSCHPGATGSQCQNRLMVKVRVSVYILRWPNWPHMVTLHVSWPDALSLQKIAQTSPTILGYIGVCYPKIVGLLGGQLSCDTVTRHANLYIPTKN